MIAMDDAEINRAVAEACGWQRGITTAEEFERSRVRDIWISPTGKRFIHGLDGPPDYCHDLNAMAAALETLPYGSQAYYMLALTRVLMRQAGVSEWDKHIATARQRAKALLRVLGRWHE